MKSFTQKRELSAQIVRDYKHHRPYHRTYTLNLYTVTILCQRGELHFHETILGNTSLSYIGTLPADNLTQKRVNNFLVGFLGGRIS